MPVSIPLKLLSGETFMVSVESSDTILEVKKAVEVRQLSQTHNNNNNNDTQS